MDFALACPRSTVIEAQSGRHVLVVGKATQEQTSPTMSTWCPLRASMALTQSLSNMTAGSMVKAGPARNWELFLNLAMWVGGCRCNSLLQSLQQTEQGFSGRGKATPPKPA